VKVFSASGTAVSVTAAPSVKSAELDVQAIAQSIPDGEVVTVPVPAPALATSNRRRRLNVAVTVAAAFIVTTHDPAPEQPPPDQPEKTLPASGAAVRVTTAPAM
jgi:hypothetical protein